MMWPNRLVIIVTLSAVFGLVRFLVPQVPLDMSTTSLFKDAAHLYVGFLIGLGYALWPSKEGKWMLLVALGLTILEVVAFLVRS